MGARRRIPEEQEVRLRSLVSGRPRPVARSGAGAQGVDDADLASALLVLQAPGVTVSGPAGPVPLPAATVADLVAAVRACLHNVAAHAGPGARAFVLLEDGGHEVVVTVRDDGVGVEPGRLEQAEGDGRDGGVAVGAGAGGRARRQHLARVPARGGHRGRDAGPPLLTARPPALLVPPPASLVLPPRDAARRVVRVSKPGGAGHLEWAP